MAWIPEPLYRDIVDRLPICTVDVALFDGDASRVMVFQRAAPPLQGDWFTLGGRMNKNETMRDCAVRQARVEAGLTLVPEKLIFGGVFDEIHHESRFGETVTYHCVNICWAYLLEDAGEIRLDSQHRRCEWRPVRDPEFHPYLTRKLASAHHAVRCRFRRSDETEA